jgi:2-oxoglutarate/2-oxoacid ferredoxin oxidoreductase subunit alpha
MERHGSLLVRGTVLITDASILRTGDPLLKKKLVKRGVRLIEIPFDNLITSSDMAVQHKNMVMLGVTTHILGIGQATALPVLRTAFRSKGDQTVARNRNAFTTGAQWATQFQVPGAPLLSRRKPPEKTGISLDGNEAVVKGALAAGCAYFASYPITPATPIGNRLAELLPLHGGVSYQAEDEIAALGSVIGASFYGIRAMTATSGPGLSLMQELIGYASMTELPVVIVDVQRAGPSTGMPTKHEQSDLLAACHGGHGDAERIVLAPVNVRDCFDITVAAFDLAQRYRCPVIILSDSSLGYLSDYPDIPMKWVSLKKRGILPERRRITGVEHDESGYPDVTPVVRTAQMDRRAWKLNGIEQKNRSLLEFDLADTSGNRSKADIAVVSWGLVASIAREAVQRLRADGLRVVALYPRLLFPVPDKAIERIASCARRLVVIEDNHSGQFASLVAMATGRRSFRITATSGEPPAPHELVLKLKNIVNKMMADGQ